MAQNIPKFLSDLYQDENHKTVTSSQIDAWNNAVSRLSNIIVEVDNPTDEALAFANGAIIVIRKDLLLSSSTTTSVNLYGHARIEVSKQQLQSGIANIIKSYVKSMYGKSRISVISVKSQNGLSKIIVTGTTQRTLSGKANIKNSKTVTTTGITRVSRTFAPVQNATARINNIKTINQLGTSRVSATRNTTQTGKSAILVNGVGVKTQSGKASVSKQFFSTQSGAARVQKSFNKQMSGLARILDVVDQTLNGKSRINRITPFTLTGISKIVVTGTTTRTETGKSSISNKILRLQNAKSRIQVSVAKTEAGKSSILRSVTKTSTGTSRIQKIIPKLTTGVSRITAQSIKTITAKSSITAQVGQATKSLTGRASIIAEVLTNPDVVIPLSVFTGDGTIVSGAGTGGTDALQLVATTYGQWNDEDYYIAAGTAMSSYTTNPSSNVTLKVRAKGDGPLIIDNGNGYTRTIVLSSTDYNEYEFGLDYNSSQVINLSTINTSADYEGETNTVYIDSIKLANPECTHSSASFDTPGTYNWTVPAGVKYVKFSLWGSGGTGVYNSQGIGGGGGQFVGGIVPVTPGTTMQVIVGSTQTTSESGIITFGYSSFGGYLARGAENYTSSGFTNPRGGGFGLAGIYSNDDYKAFVSNGGTSWNFAGSAAGGWGVSSGDNGGTNGGIGQGGGGSGSSSPSVAGGFPGGGGCAPMTQYGTGSQAGSGRVILTW